MANRAALTEWLKFIGTALVIAAPFCVVAFAFAFDSGRVVNFGDIPSAKVAESKPVLIDQRLAIACWHVATSSD